MVIGWRRAFCTSIPKEKKDSQTQSSTTTTTTTTPRFSNKFNFFFSSSSSSNSAPSTPRLKSQPSTGLRCRTTANTPNSSQPNSPKLHCKTSITTTTSSSTSSPRLFFQQSNLINNNNNNNNNNNKQQLRLRVYNDDEPLMCSPISLAHFNPIPESEEESIDDDNVIRTQGFFLVATPTSSSSSNKQQQQQQSVLLSLLPDSAVVSINRSYETHVLMMRIKSPPPTAMARGSTRGRVPVDLVAVLDASENMSGWRLQTMKRALKLVISSLGSTDRLSVVAFSSSSKRLLPLKRMSGDGRRSARRIVDALGCTGQGMNLNDAVKKAVKVLEDRRERNNVSRIIVLSDGHNLTSNSNSNNNNSCSVFPLVTTTRSTQLDIPIHIVGFGNISGYNHHAPAEDVIAKRVAALLSVVVKDLKVQIRVGSGQVAAVYSVSGKPSYLGSGSGSLLIGDMYAEEERELMIELRVPTPNSSNGPHHDSSLTVRSTMREPLSHELIHSKEQNLILPQPHHAVRSSSSPSKILRLKNLHVSTRAIAESRRLIEHDDLSGAYHLLTSARTLLVKSAGDGGSGEEFLATVEAELAEVQQRRNRVRQRVDSSSLLHEKPTVAADQLTPTSAWRAAERLAKLAIMRKHMNRVSDLHGFENARF